MAPFKLKFRMGNSRSTSQEHDPDPQVNEALLNHHHSAAIGASNSTIDSADCNSLGSLGTTSERKSLLPHKSNNLRLGYLSHSSSHSSKDSASSSTKVPSTPPPSYEHVLEEKTRLATKYEHTQQRQLSGEDNSQQQQQSLHSQHSSTNTLRNSGILSSLEQLYLGNSQCTDPDCQENFTNNEQQRLQRQHQIENVEDNNEDEDNDSNRNRQYIDNRSEANGTGEALISTNMTAPSSRENRFDGYASDCQECNGHYASSDNGSACGGRDESGQSNNDYCDSLLNNGGYCSNETHYMNDYHDHSQNQALPEYGQQRHVDNGGDDDGCWQTHQMLSNSLSQQQSYQQQEESFRVQHEHSLTPEIISNKSSKEIYKDLAKQWGITCKMSDGCRCMECQSHYFDCEFDDNEHQKTDGGLGAGTPMFISEVMHGTACNIL